MKHSLIVFALVFSVSSLFAQDGDLSLPYTQFTLDNGLTVIVHEDHSIPMVAVNVWYHVGSGHEKAGRTGFAHLFEHILFEGSGNVAEGDFDRLLEAAGGNNNGSTNTDRTNYYEIAPSNALDLMLFLESDRMGFLLDAMSPEKVDGQRDVVKNERRQSYENQPYGLAFETLSAAMYPEGHPYSWTTIGSMADLSAASYEDVVEFFKKYYTPRNSSIVIAGDITPEEAKEKAEYWFGEIPAGESVPPPAAQPVLLSEPKVLMLEDNVQLPRVYSVWHTPAYYSAGDAEMDLLAELLTSGTNSRLYKKLVYELQIAQDVAAFQWSRRMGSSFFIYATARPGHSLDEVLDAIDEEIARLASENPSNREVQRLINQQELSFLRGSQSLLARADQLNQYYMYTGNPDWANEDFSRYKAVSPADLSAMARRWLKPESRVILSIVPKGQTELAVQKGGQQ